MKDPEYNDEPQTGCADASTVAYASGPRDGGTTIPKAPDFPKPNLYTAEADPPDDACDPGDGWEDVGPRDPGTVIP